MIDEKELMIAKIVTDGPEVIKVTPGLGSDLAFWKWTMENSNIFSSPYFEPKTVTSKRDRQTDTDTDRQKLIQRPQLSELESSWSMRKQCHQFRPQQNNHQDV